MNPTNLRFMKTHLCPLWAPVVAVLLSSCAATSVEQTSRAPDCACPVGKIAVLAVADRGLLRQAFENRFVTQLRNAGASALFTYDLLSLQEIQDDKAAAANRLRAGGAEAVLIVRLVDVTTAYRNVQPGGERYAPVVTGFDTTLWYNYYSVAFMNMSPSYGSLTQKVYLETGLYDLRTEKRVWTGLTRTVLKENMDRVAEMDPLVEKIVAAMKKDGVIQ
jgi:hypothetical protein